MWNSMDDVIQDLSLLNDFGEPGNVEPYRKFYSPSKKTQFPQETKRELKMIDPRTGEPIVFMADQKKEGYSEGPNGAWLRSVRNDLELRNQLKWVRRVRPNDDEVENYFNKNAAEEKKVSQSVGLEKRIPVVPNSSSSQDAIESSKSGFCFEPAKKSSGEVKNVLLSTLIEKGDQSNTKKKKSKKYSF